MKDLLLSKLPTKPYLILKGLHYKRAYKEDYKHLQSLRKKISNKGYSFKPFDKYKTIFIHIPKCAGVSVNHTLFGNLAGGHTTLNEYLGIFEAESITNYFKFTIVRNPWDRLVSAYFFLKKGGFEKADKEWFESEISQYESFEQFVTEWVNKENILRYNHFHPQTNYIFDKYKKVPIDFVGFFENLDNDFEYIAEKIGVSERLPRKNAGEHKRYQDYYNEKTIEIVAKVYEEDIRVLGYDFENTNIENQIKLRNAIGRNYLTQQYLQFKTMKITEH